MNRRGFLGSMLAACAAPAIVRASSLMRIAAPRTVLGYQILQPEWPCRILTIDEFSARYLQAAMAKLAEGIDRDLGFPSAYAIAARLETALAPKQPWLRP